jgi:CHASE2 domain-containing sensor protein
MIRLLVLSGILAVTGLLLWTCIQAGRRLQPLLSRLFMRFRPALPVLAAALVLFGDLGLDALGSFGLADRVDETMSRAAGLVSGPFYGGLERKGQKTIVIVALDDDFIQQNGGAWPVPYSATDAVLQEIIKARPRALFLDAYFARPHTTAAGWPDVGGIRALASTIEVAKARRIPVLTGPVSPEFAALRPLARASTQVGLTPADDRPFAYSVIDADGQHVMAAVTLYQLWANKPVQTPDLPMKTLALDWGFGASAWMGERFQEPSPCVAPTYWSRLGAFLGLGWRALAPNLNRDDRVAQGLIVSCPYFDVVPAEWLTHPKVQSHLKGKLVLVGSTAPWLRDQAPTPLLGDVPGVMVHAMALDNLIEGGSNATRYPAVHEGLLKLDNSDFVQAGLLALGFAAFWWLHAVFGLHPDDTLPPRFKAGIWIAIGVLGLAIACLNHWPLFKLLSAALAGSILTAAWDEFLKHKQRPRV